MAIKELFYDNRPQVLLDPRASQRIDPRFKYTRNSIGTYFDRDGIIQTAKAGEPRFSYDPATKEYLGFLLEPTRTNLVPNSSLNFASGINSYLYGIPLNLITSTSFSSIVSTGGRNGYFSITSGKKYTISYYAKRASSLTGTNITARLLTNIGGVVSSEVNKVIPTGAGGRMTHTVTATATAGSIQIQLIGSASLNYIIGAPQVEEGDFETSYIPTSGSAVTRAADLLSVEAPLPASGSVYIDARAIRANENDTLLSLKNSSNDKIDLAYLSNTSTYDSLALIANYDGTSKSSLPLPVPTTNRERNIITWGAQNYQYSGDSSRYATSLSSSVPTGLNQLSIGHDAVDPTKAFNGYINTVYAWSGELTPAVAEALVRNEIDAINADTYSPTGPAGSLALVINTQGTASDGDKTFTLPAESAATDNDIVITWGDGTESGLDGSDAELGASGLTHTYPAAGIYPVWVEGQMENIQFNNIANANDLLRIAAWGTGDMFTSPSTMNSAFYGCTQMDFSSSARTTNLPDTSAVTNWFRAFRDCSNITGTFPAFNFSAATSFQEAWQGCSNMTSFVAAGDQTQNVTNFAGAWYNCNSLTAFPQINTSSGTTFSEAWYNCSSLTSFPLINTASGTNFSYAWYGCSGLTEFPLLNTASATNFSNAWRNCSGLTVFPLLANTSNVTNFERAWSGCSSLTDFPQINTQSGTSFANAWDGCSGLTSFPTINTSSATDLSTAWFSCSSLTNFPSISTSTVTNFFQAWRNCSSLTTFPALVTSSGTNFSWAWRGCSGLTAFPSINTGNGTNFSITWGGCSSLTSFPSLDFDSATGLASDGSTTYTGFREAWIGCTSLTTFPANRFNNTTCTRYLDAFIGCALTAASIENIIVSIEAAGTSNGNLSLQGGTNAGASTWTAAAVNAYDALVARGWTITRNA